ncbi:MAG: DHH family phosphoesterase [Candidatus Woesearchaeota archaeon]|nr:DHH family phosphoesterase [Candidatus Woesearchaeota archaeon]
MDKYEQFKEEIAKAVESFRQWDKNETIRLIGHLDSDGIAASSIMIRALNNANRKYSISIVHQLTQDVIKELAAENYSYYFFVDLGSGQIDAIKKTLANKTTIVLDHHEVEEFETNDNMTFINPHLLGIDGSKEIAGAGLAYLFASTLNEKNKDMAHIAIVGAIGDIQNNNGFLRLNEEILREAEKQGKIKVTRGLKVFGGETKPLHKVLEYSSDVFIPGVTGSESGAIQFLNDIGVDAKTGKDWNKLSRLEEEDLQKLATGIILRRLSEKKPEDIFADVYTLVEEEKESPLRDAKEFSTLLNACGRLNKASLGIGACLNDKKIKLKAIRQLTEYKKEIVNAMRWFDENKSSKNIMTEDGFMIINAEDNIMPTMIGTMASIISKSGGFREGTLILSMARTDGKMTKISLRVAGHEANDMNLKDIIEEIVGKAEGSEIGGHKQAAGALIRTEKEHEFIEAAKSVLRRYAIEEKIGE